MKKLFTLLLCVAGMCAVQVAKAATVDVATTNELKEALLLSEETTIRLTADMGMYQSSTRLIRPYAIRDQADAIHACGV